METISRPMDDWYKRINKMYLDRNFYRHPESLFAHLVEIVGGLSLLATEKTKPGVEPQAYIAKALAWWFALCGKMRIRSVEDMVWAKFPAVCPYCLESPHRNTNCKKIKKERRNPDWVALQEIAERNMDKRPRTLGQWLTMFAKIYEPQQVEKYPETFGRFSEELGELAEATRLFQLAPGYFFSEASDFFAWLMHLQALYLTKTDYDGDEAQALERAMWQQYPGKCKDCGNELCSCPPILKKTFGRIAHDMPIMSGPGKPAPLLELSEAMEAFDLSSKIIRIGGRELEVTGELVREIHKITSDLKMQMSEINVFGEKHIIVLLEIVTRVKALAESERITQDAINELTTAIAELPLQQRNSVLDFLNGLSSSLWASALVEGVKAITSG